MRQPGTNPLELLELAREAERLGYDSAWAAEAWGVDAITPLAWLGAQTTTLKLGHGDHAAARALARERGDDGGDARPALRRALPDGPRHVGPAGRRGLARAGVGEAARQDARVRRDRAQRAAARAARASRRALRHPGQRRDRARQAAQADGAPAARGDPDLPRRDRAEGRRAGVRDRRRLAADLLVAGAGARGVSARTRARGIRHRAVACRRCSPTTSSQGARRSRSTTRSTSAAWARAARTSTTTSSRATATRRRRGRSRSCSWAASSARRRRRCRTRSSTRSRSSARSSGSPTAWPRGASPVRRRCSSRRAT